MNNLSYFPQFASVSDLQRDYPSLLKSLKNSKKPLLILKKNNLEAVLLSPDYYQLMMEKVQEFDEKGALMAVANYKKEKIEKKLKKMKSIKELFE